MAAVTRPLGFTIRRLQTLEELLMCVRLQEGMPVPTSTPAPIESTFSGPSGSMPGLMYL